MKEQVKAASITVEAACVFPIFLYAILVFLYLQEALVGQFCIQEIIVETARGSAKYGYLYQELSRQADNKKEMQGVPNESQTKKDLNIINSAILSMRVYSELEGLDLEKLPIQGGKKGVLILSSFMEKAETESVLEQSEYIDIQALYQINLPVLFVGKLSKPISQQVRVRAFVGRKMKANTEPGEEKGKDEYVYITERGVVYHLTQICTHLKLDISSIALEDLKSARNEQGGKYESCRLCSRRGKVEGERVYVAKQGTAYHVFLDCSGLKRTTYKKRLSEVQEMAECSRCGKK